MANERLTQLEELEKRRGSETDPFKKRELDKQISLLKNKILTYYNEKNEAKKGGHNNE